VDRCPPNGSRTGRARFQHEEQINEIPTRSLFDTVKNLMVGGPQQTRHRGPGRCRSGAMARLGISDLARAMQSIRSIREQRGNKNDETVFFIICAPPAVTLTRSPTQFGRCQVIACGEAKETGTRASLLNRRRHHLHQCCCERVVRKFGSTKCGARMS